MTRAECKARQYSDQMHCADCALTWDVNDRDPPACRPTAMNDEIILRREKPKVTADDLRRLANKFRYGK